MQSAPSPSGCANLGTWPTSSMAARPLPEPVELTIPRDVAPGPGWSAQMREMAEHIGAYETLLICDRYGGQEIYIPADASRNPFLPLIGAAKARTLSWVYRRDTLAIPTAGYALRYARRAGLMAALRAGRVTVADAARILSLRRDYVSKLLNQTGEGSDAPPAPIGLPRADPRQITIFDLLGQQQS
jgi:hypothetical protein